VSSADLGFEAVYLTGAGLTNMHLGLPDLAFMDLSQLVEHTMAIRGVHRAAAHRRCRLPGFGNALNVGRTVRDAGSAPEQAQSRSKIR